MRRNENDANEGQDDGQAFAEVGKTPRPQADDDRHHDDAQGLQDPRCAGIRVLNALEKRHLTEQEPHQTVSQH